MAKNNALNFNLPSADDLFSTEESRAEARLEKVINLNPSEISDFPNHPFKVRMDAAMQEMTESVKQYGVLVPALVRPKPDGGYEMVAGHRRKKAAELANLTEIPCIVRQLTDDEATIIMVDSNLQRPFPCRTLWGKRRGLLSGWAQVCCLVQCRRNPHSRGRERPGFQRHAYLLGTGGSPYPGTAGAGAVYAPERA